MNGLLVREDVVIGKEFEIDGLYERSAAISESCLVQDSCSDTEAGHKAPAKRR